MVNAGEIDQVDIGEDVQGNEGCQVSWHVENAQDTRRAIYLLATRAVCMSESIWYKHDKEVVMDPNYTHLLQALAEVTM